eukprot:6227545-Alexandrium_andersonii.AAC.1
MRAPCRSLFPKALRRPPWAVARTPMGRARMSLAQSTLRNPGKATARLDHLRVSSHGLSVETT